MIAGGRFQGPEVIQRAVFSNRLVIERQGEAICFSKDGQSVIVTSEFRKQPIWQVKIDNGRDAESSDPQDKVESSTGSAPKPTENGKGK